MIETDFLDEISRGESVKNSIYKSLDFKLSWRNMPLDNPSDSRSFPTPLPYCKKPCYGLTHEDKRHRRGLQSTFLASDFYYKEILAVG